VPGRAQPQVALEHRDVLGGQEAALGGQLHGLLADPLEVLGQLGPQEDDGLAEDHAVLGPAERDGVHADVRREGAQRQVEPRGRVGQPGAVDVEQEPALVRRVGQRAQLLGAVARPELRGLRDGHEPRLHRVLVPDARHAAGDVVRA
jgi:hypothetical protein